MVEVDKPGAYQRLERDDDGGRIAARVCDQAGNLIALGRAVAVQLRQPVYSFGLQGGGRGRGVVGKAVHGAVCVLVQAPGAAQVYHAETPLDSFGRPDTRLLMRGGEKHRVDAALGKQLPGEWVDSQRVLAGQPAQRRVHRGERGGFAPAEQRRCACEARVGEQQPCELLPGIAARPDDCCLFSVPHCSVDLPHVVGYPINTRSRSHRLPARRLSGHTISTVLSPATVPTTSDNSA